MKEELKKEYEELLREYPDAIKFYDCTMKMIDATNLHKFGANNDIYYFTVKNKDVAKRIMYIIDEYTNDELSFPLWKIIQYLSNNYILDEGFYTYVSLDAGFGCWENISIIYNEIKDIVKEAREKIGWDWE